MQSIKGRFVAINQAPETRGGINEKTVSICIDLNQRKIPTDSRTDSTLILV